MLSFLFTDLEASTRLWEQHPDAMGEALARHDAMLRQAVEAAAGTVVKSTGDGLLAVFASVADTLEASAAAQRALAAAGWESTGPLRVRMGIHAGEAELRAGDYFGTAVNRAARIMAAGHGGQVLLSDLAATLAGDGLPAGAGLRDLGMHRLKDLTQPEHLFQLVLPDLPAHFPALVTLEARPNNLPVQDSEFVGRTGEMAAIQAMLDDPAIRLVTLIGPGGTGKTRLSLQVAAERIDRHADGVFFVDLSREHDPDAAYEAIDRELDLPGSVQGLPLEVLSSKLRDRRILLVLDNFEQVADAAVGVGELMARCPELKVIVTSRESLRIRAEHLFPVPPLSLPDPAAPVGAIAGTEAVKLLVERARSVVPGFTLTDENAVAIAEICLRLDGLPLALELAAARLKVFSPPDLRDRLRERIDVLGAGGRDLPARQRTVRGTIEWSYELLDPDECRMFELMSVFSTARMEAIEAVAGATVDGLDVVDVLASLVDQSLVRSIEVRGSQRFSMLNTIREYATERLERSLEQAHAVRTAHAEFYSAFARGLRDALRGAGRQAALDDLGSEIGNLRTAWRHWVDEADLERLYLLLDGLWALHDARGWYHAAVELASDMLGVLTSAEPTPERAAEELTMRTSLARALLAVRGYTPEVEEEFRRALELVERVGGTTRRFPVLRALASYYIYTANFARANEMGRELMELAENDDDPAIRIEGLFVFGASTAFLGKVEEGLSHLDRAIELFDRSTDGSGGFRLGASPGVVSRFAAALIRWQCGALDRAVELASEALALARELDHPFSLAYALYHSGFLDIDRLDFQSARTKAVELGVVARTHDYPAWAALASVLEGVALCAMGDTEAGLARTEAGVVIYRGLTTPPVFWPLVLGLRAMAFAMAGEVRKAVALADEGVDSILTQTGSFPVPGNLRSDLLMLRTIRADLMRGLPDPDLGEVEATYRDVAELSGSIGLRLVELRARTRLADLHRAIGASEDSLDELASLYGTFPEGLDTPDLAAARAVLAGR